MSTLPADRRTTVLSAMILGIVSLLGLLGGGVLVLLAGIGVFYFFRAIFPPYDSAGAESPPRTDDR